jgi:Flp pilus assembly protein TadG
MFPAEGPGLRVGLSGVHNARDDEGDALELNRNRTSTGRHRSRGQAMVEFALVFPMFILLVAGMLDFGIGLYRYMTIVNAARDGARMGANACTALGGCSAAVSARVTAASGGLNPGITVVCRTPANAIVNCASGKATSGDSITVTASYTYHMIWPLAFGTNIPMGSSAKFMVQDK